MPAMVINFIIAQSVICFSPALLTTSSSFKYWWHGHASCTVAYPSWSRTADLPNSHGKPRINNKHNQESLEKLKKKRERKMWLSISTVFLFCSHISLAEVHLISWIKVHALVAFLLHVEVRLWLALALLSVFSCHHYPLSSLVSLLMKSRYRIS